MIINDFWILFICVLVISMSILVNKVIFIGIKNVLKKPKKSYALLTVFVSLQAIALTLFGVGIKLLIPLLKALSFLG